MISRHPHTHRNESRYRMHIPHPCKTLCTHYPPTSSFSLKARRLRVNRQLVWRAKRRNPRWISGEQVKELAISTYRILILNRSEALHIVQTGHTYVLEIMASFRSSLTIRSAAKSVIASKNALPATSIRWGSSSSPVQAEPKAPRPIDDSTSALDCKWMWGSEIECMCGGD